MSTSSTTKAMTLVSNAAQIKLDIHQSAYSFPFQNAAGEQWHGCIEEWIGNGNWNGDHASLVLESAGVRYYEIAASGGGADKLLVREDESAALCYYNDYDQTISEVSSDLDQFVASLETEEE